jgi:hypothetical protein
LERELHFKSHIQLDHTDLFVVHKEEILMMKRMLILSACLLFVVSAVHAQSRTVQVTIPFDFVAGNSTMPAGTYTIAPTANVGGSAIPLRNTDSKAAAMVLPRNYASDSVEHDSGLVFKVVGGQYYLWQMWTQGYSAGREFSVNALKTQLADAAPVQTVTIAASVPKA